jgi:hypothetical protein
MIERVRAVLRKLALSKPEPLSEVEIAIGVYLHLQALRSEPGSSVEILCDNDDYGSHLRNSVICCGAWTGFEAQRYEGDSLLGCLRLAEFDRQRKRVHHHV